MSSSAAAAASTVLEVPSSGGIMYNIDDIMSLLSANYYTTISTLMISPTFLSVYIQLIIVTLVSVRYPKLSFIYVLLLLFVPWIAPIDALSTAERIFMFFHLYCCEIWRFVDYAFDDIKTADSPAATDTSTQTSDGIDIEKHSMDRIIHMLTYQGVTKRTGRVHIFTFDNISFIKCIGHSIVTYSIYNYIVPSILIGISPYFGMTISKCLSACLLGFANVSLFTAISEGMDFTFKLFGYKLEPFCQNFWGATQVTTFWRLWNTPFQRVLYRHVYHPLYHILGYSKNLASFATFVVSSAAHWVPLCAFVPGINKYETFYSWNIFFISQYLVCGIETFLKWNNNKQQYNNKSSMIISNIIKNDTALTNTLRWFFASMPNGLHHALTLLWVGISATAVHIPIVNYFYGYTDTPLYH